jgi:hypothetical protein
MLQGVIEKLERSSGDNLLSMSWKGEMESLEDGPSRLERSGIGLSE